jgi:hypothetical protein
VRTAIARGVEDVFTAARRVCCRALYEGVRAVETEELRASKESDVVDGNDEHLIYQLNASVQFTHGIYVTTSCAILTLYICFLYKRMCLCLDV